MILKTRSSIYPTAGYFCFSRVSKTTAFIGPICFWPTACHWLPDMGQLCAQQTWLPGIKFDSKLFISRQTLRFENVTQKRRELVVSYNTTKRLQQFLPCFIHPSAF